MNDKFTKLEMEVLQSRFIDRKSTYEIKDALLIPAGKVLELETKAIKKVFNILKEYEQGNN